MLVIYEGYFSSYTSVMYPYSLLSPGSSPLPADDLLTNGSTYATDVSNWAWENQGLSLGQNGLGPDWAQGTNGPDDPQNPTSLYAQFVWSVYDAEYYDSQPAPPYFELQTGSAATQDCSSAYSTDKTAPLGNGYGCTGFGGVPVGGTAANVSGASCSSGTVIMTTASAPNFTSGQQVTVGGITPSGYNATPTITLVQGQPDQFTYPVSGCPAAFVSGGWVAGYVPKRGDPVTVTAASWDPNTQKATITTSNAHTFITNQSITIGGTNSSGQASGYDGTYPITWISSTQFKYPLTNNPGSQPPYWAVASGGQTYTQCAGAKVYENVYLAQLYGAVTTLEAYYNDLDDYVNSDVGTAYSDWKNQNSSSDQAGYYSAHTAWCPANE
jgi:hypothetical protein